MAWGDGFYRKLEQRVEAKIGEPVELIALGSRPGAMAALVSGGMLQGAESALGSPIVAGSKAPSGRMRSGEGTTSTRLPMNFIVALTSSQLRVFKWRKTWFGTRVKKELGALPRDGLRVEATSRGVVLRFRLDHPDGSALAFEMTRGKFTSRFAEELSEALAPQAPAQTVPPA